MGIVGVLIALVVVVSVVMLNLQQGPKPLQGNIDVLLSGNSPDPMDIETFEFACIPFKVQEGEVWRFTVEVVYMPPNSWTEVVMYQGFFEDHNNYKVMGSQLMYEPEIINNLIELEGRLSAENTEHIEGFSKAGDYTIFIAYSTGDNPTQFHITLELI